MKLSEKALEMGLSIQKSALHRQPYPANGNVHRGDVDFQYIVRGPTMTYLGAESKKGKAIELANEIALEMSGLAEGPQFEEAPKPSTPYQLVIRNTAAFLRTQTDEEKEDRGTINAFEAARIIAIGWAKLQEDVLNDLIFVKL